MMLYWMLTLAFFAVMALVPVWRALPPCGSSCARRSRRR